MRYRSDKNSTALIKLWRNIGGSWQDTSQIPGALDGIAGYLGIDVRVEIKNGSAPKADQELTAKELKTISEWTGRPPVIWRTEDDVLATRDVILLEKVS